MSAVLLSDEVQARLIEIRHSMTVDSFSVGDIATEVIQHAVKEGFKVTQEDIFNLIGGFVGKTGRTVRYYHETARFFDVPTRQEFAMLNFAHFVVARSFGDNWREVLEYAADNLTVPASALAAKFGVDVPDGADSDVPNSADSDVPNSAQAENLAAKLLSMLSSLLERIAKITGKLPLSEDLNERLEAVTDDLRDLIPDIASEIG